MYEKLIYGTKVPTFIIVLHAHLPILYVKKVRKASHIAE